MSPSILTKPTYLLFCGGNAFGFNSNNLITFLTPISLRLLLLILISLPPCSTLFTLIAIDFCWAGVNSSKFSIKSLKPNSNGKSAIHFFNYGYSGNIFFIKKEWDSLSIK